MTFMSFFFQKRALENILLTLSGKNKTNCNSRCKAYPQVITRNQSLEMLPDALIAFSPLIGFGSQREHQTVN